MINITMREDKPYLFKYMLFENSLLYKKYRKRLIRKLKFYNLYSIELNYDIKKEVVDKLNEILQAKNEKDVLFNKFKNNIESKKKGRL